MNKTMEMEVKTKSLICQFQPISWSVEADTIKSNDGVVDIKYANEPLLQNKSRTIE